MEKTASLGGDHPLVFNLPTMRPYSNALRVSIRLIPVSMVLFAISPAALSAAPGDWPEPRQNQYLTGIQPLPGDMKTAPQVLAEYDLGRTRPSVTPVLVPGTTGEYAGLCLVSGALHRYDTKGDCLWICHPPGLNFSSVVTTEDLNGDGDLEILLKAGRPSEPYAAAVLVSFSEGKILWRYDVDPMSYAWYLYAENYLNENDRKQIVVMMHGYPPDKENGYIALFDLEGVGGKPQQKWRYDFHEYTCFPSLLRTDSDGDGVTELCVETHSRMWLLDAATGELKQFVGWDVSPANVRSYGHIEFVDLNGDSRDDFLCIATFAQHHEVLLNRDGKFELAWCHGWNESVTTGKVATTWPSPPYADVDGDGALEVVVSMFNSEEKNRWLVRIYDAVTGEIEHKHPDAIATVLQDLDGDGCAEIACNRCTDPTQTELAGCVVLEASGGALTQIWEDDSAEFPKANQRGAGGKGEMVLTREGKKFVLTRSEIGAFEETSWTPTPAPKTTPDFSRIPEIQGPAFPTLMAADLTGDGTNEILLYREPSLKVLGARGDGSMEVISEYPSSGLPAFTDLDGDGLIEIVTGEVSPTTTPVIEARTPARDDALLWRSEFPSPPSEGLPYARRLYMRTGRFTGKKTPDLYVWAGTPVVRSTVLDGRTGSLLWEKSQIGDSERYWGPGIDFASAYDYDGDGSEDLIFTNPDYYCVSSGTNGEFLAGPLFPPKIFDQPSQGLYTFPAILENEEGDPTVCLVSGHYFQGAMSLRAEPFWYKIPECGESRCSTEGFLRTREGEWLLGFGRQNGKFACVNVSDGSLRWELDVQATCSDTIACDVDGDGCQEFLFGTSHKELYAVRDKGDSPVVVWKKDLPAAAGAPIAADVNGDGKSEIILPLSNGRIWVLGDEI